MATNRREIELLISARDSTGRTFKQVSSGVKGIASDIDQQVAAASRGEASLESLRKAQQALQQAGRDLSNIQGQIDGYQRLATTVDKNKDAYQGAQAALDKYKTQLAAAEKITAAQQRTLDGLEKKVQSTGAAFRKSQTDVAAAETSLKAVGIETARLAQQQTEIIATARQTGAAFVAVGGAIDGFADNLRLAAAAEAQLNQAGSLDRKIAEAAQLGNASAFVRLYAQAVDQVHLADQRIASLNGFRAVGQMAAEASRDVSRFNVQAGTLGASSQTVAAGLRAIIEPGKEALRTLSGVEAAVDTAATSMERDKQSVGAYSAALNQLSEASAALLRQGGLIDTFAAQEAATAAARVELSRAQAEVLKFGTAMKTAEAPTEAMVRDLHQAEGALETAGRALRTEETQLIALQHQLTAAGVDTNNLAAAQDRLAAAARRAGAAQAQGNSRLGRGGAKPSGILGLNPHDLQNLSFQLQDIFVSLASGQKPLTVLVQQGTQIAGIFPGLISQVGRFALSWGPVAVAVGAATFVIYKSIDAMGKLREAAATLDLRGISTAGFDPSNLISAQRELEKTGQSAEEAKKSIAAVLDATNDPTAFAAIIVNAKALSDKLGIDVPEAIKLQTDAFTGGITATEDLATSTHLLTDEEVAHADQLFATGKSAEAHQYIQDSLTAALQRQASLSDGVLSPAIRNLKSAWDSFTGFLSKVFKPVIDEINTYIQNTIIGFTFLTGLLAGKGLEGARQDAQSVVNIPQANNNSPSNKFDAQDRRNADYRRRLNEEELANRKDLTHEQRIQIAGQKALTDAQAAGVDESTAQLAVDQARRLERRKITDETDAQNKRDAAAGRSAAARARAAQNKREAAARRLQNQQNSGSEKLENLLDKLQGANAKGSTADLADRLTAVDNKYRKIYETISKLRALGVAAVGGRTLDQISADAKIMEQQVKDQETIKFYNEQINALISERGDEISVIDAVQKSGDLSVPEAYNAALEVQRRLAPSIIANAQAALDIALKAKKALEDSGRVAGPELLGQISSATATIATTNNDQTANNVATSATAADESRLNQLISDRTALMGELQQRVDLNLMTQSAATAAMKEGWERQTPAIQAMIDKIRENVDLLHELKDESGNPLISDAAYQATIVRLNTINHQLKFTDQNLLDIQHAGEQALASGLVEGFHSIAESLVGLVSGSKSFGEALGGVLRAGISLVAKFTQAIADAILQLIALRIAKAAIQAIGLFHDGGVVGGSSGMVRSGGGTSLDWAVAPRFHTGGGMGLKSDEYRAVLQRGEEVLTADDPRHIRNIGKGSGDGGGGMNIKQVLSLDPEEIPRAMQSKSGEKTILTIIRANKPTIKQMLK